MKWLHKNAKLTPAGRALLVQRVEGGEPLGGVAAAMGVSRRTVYEWLKRWKEEGEEGLNDRSSRAGHTCSSAERPPESGRSQDDVRPISGERQADRYGSTREGERLPRTVKVVITVLLGLVLGGLGVLYVFMDVGPARSGLGQAAVGAVLFLLAGLALGFLNPEGRAWLLSGIVAWGLLLLGGYGVWISLTHPPSADLDLAFAFLVGPLALALLGGWAGARLRRAGSARRMADRNAARA